MLTKIISIIVAFLVSVFGLTAQSNNSKTGSLFWKISGNGLEKPSYILGTFHLKPGSFLDSIPGAKAALESADQMIGEVSFEDITAKQSQMQGAAMMPSDTTYKMLYTEEEYQTVNEALTSFFGVGLDKMGAFNPAGIYTTYTVMLYQKYFPNVSASNSLDMVIQSLAKEKGKPVYGLESIEHQVYVLFQSSSLKRQAEVLLCVLTNQEYSVEVAHSVIKAYDQADLNELYKITNPENTSDTPCPGTQEENDLINKDRNDAWMLKLPEMMTRGSSFIAVGALHLAGEEGLLHQLEMAGYQIDAVRE